jgi:hypothetical protein
MTDAEIDPLARNILVTTAVRIKTLAPHVVNQIEQTDDGEIIPTYEATSSDGYGSFICSYMPLEAIKKIIIECERLVDGFTIEISNKETGEKYTKNIGLEQTPASRELSIRTMAENAAINMIGAFGFKLKDALEETVNDGLVIAKVSLTAVVAQFLENQGISDRPADVRLYIEEAAKRVYDKKRADLMTHIDGLPNLMAKRGQGAPRKTKLQRQDERVAYIEKVKAAYRTVRRRDGKKPTKGSVATELGVGGVNPKKGSDTRLNAFGNKLRSLEINYQAIVSEVEAELHK